MEEKNQFEERKNNRYEEAAIKYKDYLEEKIEKEVDNIARKELLERMYGYLIQTSFGEPAKIPDDINYAKKKIFCCLINQYTTRHEIIGELFSHKPKIVDYLRKHELITEATKKLENNNQEFLDYLKNNIEILTKRKDSGFEAFIKDSGIPAPTIGLEIRNYFLYTHLFGSKVTEDAKLINVSSTLNLKSNTP